jgi:transposase
LCLLWVKYREAHPAGYGPSQFCALNRQWAKHLKPSMRLTHKGGEKVFVDGAGQTVPIVDPHTGEAHQAHIFIDVLGASNHTYAEAGESQTLFSRIGAHVRVPAFFGAVPEIVVADRLKAGVQYRCCYEPVLNPTCHDMDKRYGPIVEEQLHNRVCSSALVTELRIAGSSRDGWLLGIACGLVPGFVGPTMTGEVVRTEHASAVGGCPTPLRC